MPDTFSAEFRSAVMSRIRASGTTPERRAQTLIGLIAPEEAVRYNATELPGRPDIVLDDLRVVVFVDGCFFHMCPQHARIPGTRPEYWGPKLERNRLRDRRNRDALRRKGWSVWRVWEHDLTPRRLPWTERRLARMLSIRRTTTGQPQESALPARRPS